MSRRVALVTGGNRGIGLEVCKQLASGGHAVWMGVRNLERGARAAALLRERYGVEVTPLLLDLSAPDSIERAAAAVLADGGRVDVLVNNAALAHDGRTPFMALPMAVHRELFEVNFFGAMHLCRLLLPPMAARGWGRVVNVSSGRGSFTKLAADGAAYRMSKVALNALTVVLHDELKGRGVLINACNLGPVATRLTAFKGLHSVKEGAAEVVRLATLPDDGPSGGFFKYGEPFPW